MATGDRSLAQSMLFMIDAALSRAVAQAVAMGDVGSVYEGIKMMLFNFAGSGHTKYAGYLLEMITSLEFESDEALRTLFLRNWLVNPSGEAGRHQEGDLMQEHLNLALEEAVQRSGSEWDGKLIRDVISRNIHYFVDLKNGWGESVGLAKRKGYHPEPHSKPEVTTLLRVYKETHLHQFMAGRSYASSPATANTHKAGLISLQAEKLQKWIIDSTRGRMLRNDTPGASTLTELQRQMDELDVQDTAEDDIPGPATVEAAPPHRVGRVRLVDGELVIEMEETDVRKLIGSGEGELDEEPGPSPGEDNDEEKDTNDDYMDEIDDV
ncbi:uncharacterized protein B0H18DRAFT_1121064 [Fomitopsis serialis]|uniref:uncharacterized protein n=1 Tax=Fomitopsis serialis TaxID=139415 RepID=UPI0020083222|nr:uncharacterized protein B0H18DRAFT_1121064 [Neoantrodia serialis]KAH9922250.1 hypothetical protein B0H18DRAFT_1121064 [Neoantrodia serialis]